MLSINTNLSSLIVQGNLQKSTDKLNLAIERMTTGYKINHASDNAANFSISTNMDTKLSSYDVAQENVEMALDAVTTASDSLSVIQDRVERLRYLQEQAMNGTYSEKSLVAINEECNTLVDEINRLYLTTEYNGVNLFLEMTQDENGNDQILQETTADETTTLKDLGIETSSFSVYDSNDTLIETYDVEASDTIGDIFTALQTHGFISNIQNGQIAISSNNGSYISGDLAVALGIETQEKNYVSSTNQTSSIPVTYESISSTTTEVTEQVTTTTSTTSTNTIWVTTTTESTKTEDVWVTNTIEHTTTEVVYTTTTISNTITETIETEYTIGNTSTSDSVINYSSSITATVNATTTTALSTLGLTGNYCIDSVSFNGTTTIGELVLNLNSAGISATFTDGVLSFGGQIFEKPSLNSSKRVANQTTLVAGQTYYISTDEDFFALADLVSAGVDTTSVIFEMTNDINMADAYWNSFTGIGNEYEPFRGVFHGNGHTISNLSIKEGDYYAYVGLFGRIVGATIDSVNIINSNIETYEGSCAGGLVGAAFANSTISSCYSSVTLKVCGSIGGLIGYVSNSTITDCYSSSNVSAMYDDKCEEMGGLIGYVKNSTITNSYSTGRVTGGTNQGGLVGYIEGSSVVCCYSTGTLSNSYDSSKSAGGLIGKAVSSDITNCYSTGSCSAFGITKGGFIGKASNLTGTGNYYNSSATSKAVGSGTFAGATGTSTAEILTSANLISMGFTEANNWNFVDGQNPTVLPKLYINSTTINALGLTNQTNKVLSKTFKVEEVSEETLSVTLSTTLSQLGLNSLEYLVETTQGFITLSSSSTFNNLITGLQGHNITASLTNGILSLGSPSDTDYIKTIDSNLLIAFKLSAGAGYTYTSSILQTETEKIEYTTTTTQSTQTSTTYETTTTQTTQTSMTYVTTTTKTTETETTYHTTTSSQTRTETLFSTATLTATGSTTFGEMGAGGFNVNVFTDGALSTLNIGANLSITDFLTQLSAKGITATESGGIVTLNGVGDSYVSSSVLSDLFNLGALNKTTATKTVNTKSDEQRCTVNILDRLGGNIYAPGEINLQVGINAQESSQLKVQTAFQLTDYDEMRRIGTDEVNRLDKIDKMLATLSARQTEFGAVQNRLISILDEIAIQQDNLVSALSTIRDADMAEISSQYIQQQILQQASATLLATANQTPALALQLL